MFFWRRAKEKQPKPRGLDRLSSSLEDNLHWLEHDLFVYDETIIYRRFKTGEPHGRPCLLVYADNMTDSEFVSDYVLKPMMKQEVPRRASGHKLATYLSEQVIQTDEVSFSTSYADLSEFITTGYAVILVDGCDVGIVIEAKGWDKRAISEPPSENVVRGPRQGFTEDLGVNLNQVRRRIIGPQFKVHSMQVGSESKTKIAIVYVEGIASTDLVEEVKSRIERIEIDAVLDSGYIEEMIRDSPNVPFPTIGSTERPDVVAANILEGRVAVLVDGSPFALTMPYLFVESFQSNEDYFHPWMFGSFHRLIRYISFFITTSTPALYLALIAYHAQLIPTTLAISIAAARKEVPFPGIVEVIGMGLVFEILREGGLRLPRPIGQAISIVGAIVLGDAAVTARLVGAPMIVVVALTAIAGFVVSSIYDTAVIIRLFLAVLASVLGLYGYIIGVMAIVLLLSSMKSFGVPYLSSLLSLSSQGVKDTAIRLPWWQMALRPRYLGAKDRQRVQRDSRSKKP